MRTVSSGQWPQFLQAVSIDGLRGWAGQSVEFKFPVIAVVGENGSGKSTLLKTCACAYENERAESKRFYPSIFFIDTHWDSIQVFRLLSESKEVRNVNDFHIKSLRNAGEHLRRIVQSEMSIC